MGGLFSKQTDAPTAAPDSSTSTPTVSDYADPPVERRSRALRARPSADPPVERQRLVLGVSDYADPPVERRSRAFRASPSADPPVERPRVDVTKESTKRRPLTTTCIEREKDNRLIVAAIDFGTTFSGYAYSFRHKPEEIFTHYWEDGAVKTPTVVLLDKDEKLISFGSEARKEFLRLIEGEQKTGRQQSEKREWYFFEHFKMKLFSQEKPLDRNVTLEDINGNELPAMVVFSAAIKYIVDHLMTTLQNHDSRVTYKHSDIHLVLTVPAIWPDWSKQFMREAAEKAGVDGKLLTLALEPEAASLFCRKKETSGLTLTEGTRYLVLDLGGGTADIIAHEINADGSLTEIHIATGGAFGGKAVDNQFRAVLNKIFGAHIIKKFQTTHTAEYFDLVRSFEVKKKMFDGTKGITMTFPAALIKLFEQEVGMDLSKCMEQSPLGDKLEFKLGKIFIHSELAKQCFDVAVTDIVSETEKLLDDIENLHHLILVGGFSESPYLTKVFKSRFSNLILTPKEPSSAVVKGAVMYGHENKAVVSRVCKYTYGIARMMRFKPWHNNKHKVKYGRTEYCDNLFNKHIEIGQQVRIGEKQEPKDYYPPVSNLKHAVLEVYASTDRDPVYVTEDSCRFVGLVRIDLPDFTTERNWKINVLLRFGGTELIVEAHDVNSNTSISASVDFLG